MKLFSRRLLGIVFVLAVVVGGVVMIVRQAGQGTVPSGDSPRSGAYYCPMHPTYTSDRPGDCSICNMKLVKRERKILYWTDPMIPGYRSDQPGKSPMGMDLVPVYEEGSAAGSVESQVEGYAAVRLAPEKQPLIGMKTAPVERRALTRVIRTVGTVAYDPALYQAQAEYLQAVRALTRVSDQGTVPDDTAAPAQALVDSARLRLQVLGLSPAMIEEMAAWEGPDRRLLVADPGGRVWVYATIYESELSLVAVGQTALVEAPGVVLEGAVQAIDPILDAATRSARARVALTDPAGVLKPGMFVDVSLRVTRGEGLVVPASAVMSTGTRSLVFVSHPDGMLEPREVTVGIRAEEVVEVVSGVAEAEQVVTGGNFLIDSESRLKAALEGMAGGGHQHGQ